MSAQPGQLVGARNGNWKGGRTINEDGYVLLRVGREHPLADVRGYAYEHRLVMSAKLGRWVTVSTIWSTASGRTCVVPVSRIRKWPARAAAAPPL